MAMAFSEALIELWLCPDMSLSTVGMSVAVLGVAVVIVGHYFRISSLFTAGISFTHQIQTEKRKEHKLVTTGVYSIV